MTQRMVFELKIRLAVMCAMSDAYAHSANFCPLRLRRNKHGDLVPCTH